MAIRSASSVEDSEAFPSCTQAISSNDHSVNPPAPNRPRPARPQTR
jgi:hypothetical protein